VDSGQAFRIVLEQELVMSETVVVGTRRRLGRVGVGLMTPIAPADAWRAAVQRVEKAGYTAVWVNESIGGRETFAQMGLLLAASERLVVGSGIANLWARHPATMRGGAAVLADAYPGRLALGVGVSMDAIVERSGQRWTSPLERMREYLAAMDTAADLAPRPQVPFPRLVAALGPRMLQLAGEHADGALPAAMPVAHTRRARETLGPDKLLVVMQGAILETDPEQARAAARLMSHTEQPNSPYARALRALGHSEAELHSDELLDARFPWGDPATVAEKVRTHLDAGADHVCLNVFAPDLASTADQLERLAPFLL
jgi:probable F420-dependent oxidoreductase